MVTNEAHEVECTQLQTQGPGLLLVVCPDCMTNAEMLEGWRASAAAMVDGLEEHKAMAEMLVSRGHDWAKAQLEQVEARLEEARVNLAALMAVDTDEDEGA